jgi:hypothetical protein
MSDFWTSDLGEITGNAADAFAKSFTQIPDGTTALAKIESFVNAEYNGNKYLSLSWLLTDGDFKGAKVEQKLKVYGDPQAKDSAKTRYRALNMLKLIYQLYSMKPKHSGEPNDQDLAYFIGKNAGIKIRETEPNDQGRQYNWVAEIHDAKGFKCETGIKLVVTHTQVNHQNDLFDNAFSRNKQYVDNTEFSDDIPF